MVVSFFAKARYDLRKPKDAEVFCGSAHREVNDFLARKICDDLQIPQPWSVNGGYGQKSVSGRQVGIRDEPPKRPLSRLAG